MIATRFQESASDGLTGFPRARPMLRAGLSTAAAIAICLFLSSCSDPEGDANKEFVSISTEMATAATQPDPIARFEALRELSKRIDTLKQKYATTNVAVKLAADEKIGPYRPSELRAEIETLSHSPAFCERDPNYDCLSDFISKHEDGLTDDDRLRASSFRIALALREGNTSKASLLLQKMIDAFRRGDASSQKMILPELGLSALFSDMTRSSNFWTATPSVSVVSSLLGKSDTQSTLKYIFNVGVHTRLETADNLDAVKQLISLANVMKDQPEILDKVLTEARGLAHDDLTENDAKAILAMWPKDRLPILLGYLSAAPIWSAMSKEDREAAAFAWPTGKLDDIPWEARRSLGPEFLKKMMETRTDSKDLSLLAISYLDAEGKDLAAADFLRIVGKVERYSQRQVILRGITDRLVSKSADATALAAYLVSLNATSSDPADQAKYTSSNALWTKLAAAASADDDTKLLTAAAEEGNLWQEELRLVETSRYRPDLLPIDKLVELSIKWSDKFYSRSDAAVSLFTADVMNCLLGRYAVKGVTNENIERFFAGYLGKPYTDPSQATFHTYLSDLSQRGMQPLADKLAQMAKTSGNWMASRSYHTWEVERAMDSKDLSAALTALSAFDRGDAGQYLQDFVLSALNDPLRKALWDEVVSNEPEVALSALNDRRFRGPSELETALDSLPRIYGTKDISEERRLQAQALYARLLWIVRDKQRLGRLAFHPENIDPIVWYMASDELMGLYSKADN